MHNSTDTAVACATSPFIRVGIVTTSYPSAGNPYSGIFVQRLVSHFPPSVRATVLCPCPEMGITGDSKTSAGHNLTRFSYAPRKWQRLAHRPGGIPDTLRRRDPALLLAPSLVVSMFIHCVRLAGKVDVLHGNWSGPGLVAAAAARLRGRQAVVTLRGSDVTRISDSILFRATMVVCLTLNHRVVAVSESMREYLCETFPKHSHKIVFLSDGAAFKQRDKPLLSESPLKLVTVSNLVKLKRVETLLNAVSQLSHRLPLVLRIVGEGPQRESLAALARSLNIGENVEFVGQVPPDSVMDHLNWADLFLFASESEGRPNAVLEAMAAGLPTIATDLPGVRELVHDGCGLLVPVGDADAFARCILELAENPDTALAMGRAAKATIERLGLTWPEAARRYTALYESMCEAMTAPRWPIA